MAESQKRKLTKPTLETRDLIRLVQEKRCLWDRNYPEYRDRSVKEAAWVEIYKVIEPDYDEFSVEMKNLIGSQITRKWYNVRDSYVKSKKHNIRNKPYIYAKHLTFLDAIHFDQDLNQDSEYDESRNAEENIEEHWLNDVLVVDDDNNSEQDVNKTKEFDKTQEDDNIVSVLANLINREEDDDRAFFKSIIPMVKSLSENSKFEFRIQVMNLLKTLKSKDRKKLRVKKELGESYNDSDDD